LTGCFSLAEKENPYLITPPDKPESIRSIPHTFALSLISNRANHSVTVEAFNTGFLKTRGEAVSARKSYNSKVNLDVPVYLIRHAKEGLILFGAGLSTEKKRRPEETLLNALKFLASFDYGFRYRQKKGQDIISRLKNKGVNPGDVKWLIVPYWNPATVGMLDAFPNAQVVVSRREWEWRKEIAEKKSTPGPIDPKVFEGKIKLKLVDINNKPPFGAFENGYDFFGDGSFYLVNLPGRTPGNMGAWLNLDRGPALLTGGATFVVDNFLDLALPVKGKIVDLDAYWLSLHIIKAMRRDVPQLVVLPGNDLTPVALANRLDITSVR
jgi:glyoxylase-like metal-dependent hydrolase (beta-lactamase superfamily II)